MIPYVLIGLIVGIAMLGLLVYLAMKKKAENKKSGIKEEPDYKAFYIIGISLLPLGIVFTAVISPGFIGFIAIGLIYMYMGLANRDKWKNEE